MTSPNDTGQLLSLLCETPVCCMAICKLPQQVALLPSCCVSLSFVVKGAITRDKKDLASGQVAFAACLLSAFLWSYAFVFTIYFVLSLSLFLATRVGFYLIRPSLTTASIRFPLFFFRLLLTLV
jgi:hypothetical protein